MTDEPVRLDGHSDVTVLAVALDCADLARSAAFWCELLGYIAEPYPSGRYWRLVPANGNGIGLLLQQVPEPKVHKNRMHLDLRVPDLHAAVDRIVSLGARRITQTPIEEDGWMWHVLADPDGNEFCCATPASTED